MSIRTYCVDGLTSVCKASHAGAGERRKTNGLSPLSWFLQLAQAHKHRHSIHIQQKTSSEHFQHVGTGQKLTIEWNWTLLDSVRCYRWVVECCWMLLNLVGACCLQKWPRMCLIKLVELVLQLDLSSSSRWVADFMPFLWSGHYNCNQFRSPQTCWLFAHQLQVLSSFDRFVDFWVTLNHFESLWIYLHQIYTEDWCLNCLNHWDSSLVLVPPVASQRLPVPPDTTMIHNVLDIQKHGTWWHMMAHDGTWWHMMAHDGTWWHMMAHGKDSVKIILKEIT